MEIIPPKLTPISQSIYQKIDHDDFDLIISCGRKSVVPSIHLKNISNKKVFNIHIQDPKIDLTHFDFIVSPEHDAIEGPNVITTKGAIHYLTENEISENQNYLSSFIKKDERKIWTLILGGPTKYYDYSTKNMKYIFTMLYKLLKKHNFQLVVIPSMRTPVNTIHYAKEFFGENHTIIMDVDKKAYLSALAISENIIVTCDSSSMISEAALTGKPIYIASILPKKNDKRFQRFRNLFRELNITRNLGEEVKNWSYPKLDETNRVASIIKQKINSLMSFLNSIKNQTKKYKFPFDHWEYNNALSDGAIEEIIKADIPDVSKHNLNYDGTRAIDGGAAEFREGIASGGEAIKFRCFVTNENEKQFPNLVKFIKELQSKEVHGTISKMIDRDLSNSYVRVEVICDREGFWLKPHCDIKEKLMSGLIFVNNSNESEELGTDFYNEKLEKVKTVPYKNNYGYMFTSGPNTWHGMEKKKIVKERRCLQVNYVSFPTDWKVK